MQRRKKSRLLLAGVRLGRSPVGPSSPSRRGGSSSAGRRLRLPVHATQGSQSRKRREGKVLARSASEPALWYGARVHPVPQGLSPPSPPPPPLERPLTCYDVFSPDSPFTNSASVASSLPNRKPWEEAKVVVNVTVEGSVGPVKAMVRLGASIREAIAAVVARYDREGRSPRLDPAAAEAFQLHHSHFCLQSLNKNDKIGDVGGRNFYLHRNDGSNGLFLQSEESDVNISGREITQSYGGQLAGVPYHHQLFAMVIKKLDKIGRRTKRIWRFLTCNCT